MEAVALSRRERLHQRGIRLEWFTISWNVIEASVAIGVGVGVGSVVLVGFGVDSGIEVISAVALLWRLKRAGPDASKAEESEAERRALYLVAATFFLLAVYITVEALSALAEGGAPESSTVGVVLAAISLAVMPTLAYLKQRTARGLGEQGTGGRRR
jgi:divalent metal cation (Fe/Co/Zn/Cd) transporter